MCRRQVSPISFPGRGRAGKLERKGFQSAGEGRIERLAYASFAWSNRLIPLRTIHSQEESHTAIKEYNPSSTLISARSTGHPGMIRGLKKDWGMILEDFDQG